MREPGRRGVGRLWLCALAGAFVLVLQERGAAQDVSGTTRPAPLVVAQSPASQAGLAEQLDALRLEVSELRAALQSGMGATEPAWATEMRVQLEQRIERLAVMQERLAARIETPTPRLTEPVVLFTVAGCMLLFGFIVGRGVQRRSARRDSRLRL